MKMINLRDFYYWYTQDEFIEVSDKVAEEMLADKRYEQTHKRRVYRNKAQYSLDVGDGIENAVCVFEPSPQELLERIERFEQLCRALNSLSEAQGQRIDACIILDKSYQEVAEAEGVDVSTIRKAIVRGLRNMRKLL